jgi:hypothetical protein
MQCLKTELHAVTAVTAVLVVVMMMMVVAAILYLLIEINESRKMILQGEN